MKTKAERVTALMGSEHSPIRTQAALEAMSETELTNLETHVTKKEAAVKAATQTKQTRIAALVASSHCEIKTEAALMAMSEAELTALEARVKTATDEAAAAAATAAAARAASTTATPTEEEWMRTAPASVRTLVETARKKETAQKTTLVTQLKAAQKIYSEADLNAMTIEQLEKVAALANIEPVDYGGMGFPRAAAEGTTDVYRNPPNSYRIALDKKSGKDKEATTTH